MIDETVNGDLFISKGLIFRVSMNHHPGGYVIGCPKYSLVDGKVKKVRGRAYSEPFLREIPNSTIEVPMVRKSDVEKYFSCLKLGKYTSNPIFEDYFKIKTTLLDLGIKNIGLTGSVLLKSNGLDVDVSNSDLDFIVSGKKNVEQLYTVKEQIFESLLDSYIFHPSIIYERRRRTTPLKIDFRTALDFEARKPVGLFKGRHINITPNYKGPESVFGFDNISRKDLGLVTTQIKILDNSYANTVPGFYEIEAEYDNKNLELLITNLFFYSLCEETGLSFKVKGHLVEEKLEDKVRYVLHLHNWGKSREYVMNLI